MPTLCGGGLTDNNRRSGGSGVITYPANKPGFFMYLNKIFLSYLCYARKNWISLSKYINGINLIRYLYLNIYFLQNKF